MAQIPFTLTVRNAGEFIFGLDEMPIQLTPNNQKRYFYNDREITESEYLSYLEALTTI